MLTKEHLKYRVRKDQVKPVLIAADDAAARATAQAMLAVFQDAVGMSLSDLDEAAVAVADGDMGRAFAKLLTDACGMADDDGETAAWRWDVLVQAQCRVVTSYDGMDDDMLIRRYNCAQVQGLLLRARRVVIRLKDAALGDKRELFRQLKFHQLIGLVRDEAGVVEVELSGPLSIFEQSATYGMRLANFFPHLPLLPRWEITADLKLKEREVSLTLGEKSGLLSVYRQRSVYIPEELQAFVAAFNEREYGWQASVGGEFVPLGQESYCFPDLTLTTSVVSKHAGLALPKGKKANSPEPSNRVVHVELFHRWHAKALLGRLQVLDKKPVSGLLLGVAKNLAKSPDLAPLLQASPWFNKFGFVFSEFPTPKTVAALLDKT